MDSTRRSANYPPSPWDDHFIQSLKSEFVGEPYETEIKKMKEEVKRMIEKATNPLEMIETIQRLGIAYHFEDQIEAILNHIYHNKYVMERLDDNSNPNLYVTALEFRLLRQQGYNAPQEVFNNFKDDEGKFKASFCDDLKALIYLHEASYLMFPGETTLEEARDFASMNITKYLKNKHEDKDFLVILARHEVELPLYWRMQRAESRWFIDVYENSPSMNPTLLHFAKLDFNMVQAIHQQDLKHASSWWKETRLGEKLNFARDRMVELFVWTIGILDEPKFSYFRRILSRLGALTTVLDDIFDVYGTFDELELFTNIITRWDINQIDQLPGYMKMYYQFMNKTINEMTEEIGVHILPHLKKEWENLSKAYLIEAKWFRDGYTPTLQEYLENAIVTTIIPLLLVHGYFLATGGQATEEISECLKKYPSIIQYSSLIIRLADDLETSEHEQKRGDNSKAMQCYMHETGKSEEEARKHVHHLISETWKKINEDHVQNKFSKIFMKLGMNFTRTAQFVYQYGDGLGALNQETENHILSLLVKPISLD